jgi:hypothetical protein
MNSKLTALLCGLLTAALFTCAQEKKAKSKDFKYGKISPAEFEIKASGADSAASAMVLFDVGKGWFELNPKTGDFMYVMERHTRYKIFNKDGYDYANLELEFYRKNGTETALEQMDGATYSMENGKITVNKINKESKFTEKQDESYTVKKFTLPNVKEGTIIEYKYRLKSDFIFTLRPWNFQREIPTLYSEYQITIPEWYKYRVTAGGYIYLNAKEERINESFSTPKGPGMFSLGCLKMNYHADSVPALKTESFVTSMRDHISRVGFELTSITVPGRVYQEFTNTWPQLIKGLKTDENFGGFISRKSHIKTLIKSIVKVNTNPDTTLQLIFNYVKNNIKWNDYYHFYSSDVNPKTIFEKKTGNSADINLSLYMLLAEAGIPASPVLLSTRDNGAHPGLPMLSVFNNVIVVAVVGDKQILLDATDKNHFPGLISYDDLNHDGFQLDLAQEDGKWISLDDKNLSRKVITYALSLSDENKMTGKLYMSSTNYEGLNRRNKYLSATNEEDFLKNYKADKTGLAIKNYQIGNLTNLSEPLTETMDVLIEDNVEEAGNLAYFTPLLFEKTKENPFKLEDRKFPVDFGYATEEIYRITIDIPKNYQLDKGPKNEKVILPDESASFSFIFASDAGKIMVTSKITLKKPVYTNEEYIHLKELFKNIVRKQSEQIVLKKI